MMCDRELESESPVHEADYADLDRMVAEAELLMDERTGAAANTTTAANATAAASITRKSPNSLAICGDKELFEAHGTDSDSSSASSDCEVETSDEFLPAGPADSQMDSLASAVASVLNAHVLICGAPRNDSTLVDAPIASHNGALTYYTVARREMPYARGSTSELDQLTAVILMANMSQALCASLMQGGQDPCNAPALLDQPSSVPCFFSSATYYGLLGCAAHDGLHADAPQNVRAGALGDELRRAIAGPTKLWVEALLKIFMNPHMSFFSEDDMRRSVAEQDRLAQALSPFFGSGDPARAGALPDLLVSLRLTVAEYIVEEATGRAPDATRPDEAPHRRLGDFCVSIARNVVDCERANASLERARDLEALQALRSLTCAQDAREVALLLSQECVTRGLLRLSASPPPELEISGPKRHDVARLGQLVASLNELGPVAAVPLFDWAVGNENLHMDLQTAHGRLVAWTESPSAFFLPTLVLPHQQTELLQRLRAELRPDPQRRGAESAEYLKSLPSMGGFAPSPSRWQTRAGGLTKGPKARLRESSHARTGLSGPAEALVRFLSLMFELAGHGCLPVREVRRQDLFTAAQLCLLRSHRAGSLARQRINTKGLFVGVHLQLLRPQFLQGDGDFGFSVAAASRALSGLSALELAQRFSLRDERLHLSPAVLYDKKFHARYYSQLRALVLPQLARVGDAIDGFDPLPRAVLADGLRLAIEATLCERTRTGMRPAARLRPGAVDLLRDRALGPLLSRLRDECKGNSDTEPEVAQRPLLLGACAGRAITEQQFMRLPEEARALVEALALSEQQVQARGYGGLGSGGRGSRRVLDARALGAPLFWWRRGQRRFLVVASLPGLLSALEL